MTGDDESGTAVVHCETDNVIPHWLMQENCSEC